MRQSVRDLYKNTRDAINIDCEYTCWNKSTKRKSIKDFKRLLSKKKVKFQEGTCPDGCCDRIWLVKNNVKILFTCGQDFGADYVINASNNATRSDHYNNAGDRM